MTGKFIRKLTKMNADRVVAGSFRERTLDLLRGCG